jgi:hypothetical protein
LALRTPALRPCFDKVRNLVHVENIKIFFKELPVS